MSTHQGCFANIRELEIKLNIAQKALHKITIELGPDNRGHSPRNAVSIGLGIAFDALVEIDQIKNQGLEHEPPIHAEGIR